MSSNGKVVQFNELKQDRIDRHNAKILDDDKLMEKLCDDANDVAEYIKQVHNSLGYKVKIF